MYEETGIDPLIVLIIQLVLIVVAVIGLWKLFEKAGKPGWASIIPIYNTCMLIDIAGKPIWWVLLLFIPLVNVIVGILVMIELAKRFGRGIGTALGLIFFPLIFLLILGFGSAQYQSIEAE